MTPIHNSMGKTLTAFALPLLFVIAPLSALSQSSNPSPLHINELGGFATSSALACGSAFQSGLDSGSDCLVEQLVNQLLVGSASRWANARGKQLFGQHFSLTNRLTYTAGGLSGELDAVIPVMALAGGDSPNAGAFFLQHGVTRYTDAEGLPRNDVRYGAVRRFNLSGEPGANVLGVSTFYQENLEYGHGRMALGMDYGGNWGRGAFNYFMPTTDWVPSLIRPGREERPLEGMELSFRLAPTNTVGLETALTRWEDRDGSGRCSTGARLGVQWRPHDWLSIGTARDGIGTVDAQSSIQVGFQIPLGRRSAAPRWRGFGLAEQRQSGGTASMWSPVQNIGQIRVAERTMTPEMRNEHLLRDMDVQFLQSSASSGSAIRVQVTLEEQVTTTIRLQVRLKPGQGDNPAVAGEDFADETVELLLAEGTARGEVTIQLLRNDEMSEPRSLSVAVSVAGVGPASGDPDS